jgi:hypothetical protein
MSRGLARFKPGGYTRSVKAIPLIACLALVAAQGRAQTCQPAGGAAPTEASAQPPSQSDLAQLSGRIASIRTKSLSADDANQLGKIETGITAAQTKGDLQNCGAALDRLFPSAAGSKTAAPAPPDAKSLLPKTPDFQSKAAEYFAATNDPGRFYEGSANYSASVGAAPSASAGSVHGAVGSNSRPSAYDYINAAPSTPPSLRPFAVPSPTLAGYQDLRKWVDEYGYPLRTAPAPSSGLNGDPSAAPTPAAAPSADSPPAPPAEDPSSYKSLARLIDFDSVDHDKTLIGSMQKKSITKDGTVVRLLTSIAHDCYLGVKWMLALVLGAKQPDDLGLPKGSAYMMLAELKNHPEMQKKLHLLPLDLTTFPYETTPELPARTLLIWDHDCAGFKKDGHIEFTLPISMIGDIAVSAFYESGHTGPEYRPLPKNMRPTHPILACSDGCQIDAMASESTAKGLPNPRDANGYRNLIYYAGSKGGKCLSAYVPVKDEAAAAAVQTAAGQIAGGSGL